MVGGFSVVTIIAEVSIGYERSEFILGIVIIVARFQQQLSVCAAPIYDWAQMGHDSPEFQLNPHASKEALIALRTALSKPLPSSYKAFLECANGGDDQLRAMADYF